MSVEEDKSLAEALGRLARGPKASMRGQLIAQKLAKATVAKDPLDRIVNICEAAHLSEDKDGLDMSLIDACLAVSLSLQNTPPSKDKENGYDFIRVSWGFAETEENYTKHIAPWLKVSLSFYPWHTALRRRKYPMQVRHRGHMYQGEMNELEEWREKAMDEIHEEIRSMPAHESFFEMAGVLSIHGFSSLKTEFSVWALTNLLDIQAQVAEEVDPRAFRDAMALASGIEAGDVEKPVKEEESQS